MEKMEAFSWFHGAALTGVRADAAALAKSNTTRSAEFSAVHAASPVSGDTIVFPVRTTSAAVDISFHHRGITLPAGLNAERATAGMSGPGPGLAAMPSSELETPTQDLESTATAKHSRVACLQEADREVRVHVESHQADRVAVWLGISGPPELAASRAGMAVSELRRQLAAAGRHLEFLVCNGIVVHQPASTSMRESP